MDRPAPARGDNAPADAGRLVTRLQPRSAATSALRILAEPDVGYVCHVDDRHVDRVVDVRREVVRTVRREDREDCGRFHDVAVTLGPVVVRRGEVLLLAGLVDAGVDL